MYRITSSGLRSSSGRWILTRQSSSTPCAKVTSRGGANPIMCGLFTVPGSSFIQLLRRLLYHSGLGGQAQDLSDLKLAITIVAKTFEPNKMSA